MSVDKPTFDTVSVTITAAAATIAAAGTDATPVLKLPQSKRGLDAAGGGAVVAAALSPSLGVSVSGSSPSPRTNIAARSPASARAYVAHITTSKADKGTTPEPEPELKRLSSGGGGLVSRLAAAIEQRDPSPVVKLDGAGSFGRSSSFGLNSGGGGGVPKIEVKIARCPLQMDGRAPFGTGAFPAVTTLPHLSQSCDAIILTSFAVRFLRACRSDGPACVFRRRAWL